MQFRLLNAAAPEELVCLGQEAALALVALMEAPHVAENHHLETGPHDDLTGTTRCRSWGGVGASNFGMWAAVQTVHDQ